jgi:hypothetical protein
MGSSGTRELLVEAILALLQPRDIRRAAEHRGLPPRAADGAAGDVAPLYRSDVTWLEPEDLAERRQGALFAAVTGHEQLGFPHSRASVGSTSLPALTVVKLLSASVLSPHQATVFFHTCDAALWGRVDEKMG